MNTGATSVFLNQLHNFCINIVYKNNEKTVNRNPNQKNLKPFSSGQSGNLKGRPKGTPNKKTIIQKWLDTKESVKSPFTKKEEKLTQFDIMVLGLIAKARKGDVAAFNALLDRLEGRPAQSLRHSGDTDGTPIHTETVHRVIFEDYTKSELK
ncbi:hypothetical protein BH10BAC3_BH10BAC3_16100 [soil metagenome]